MATDIDRQVAIALGWKNIRIEQIPGAGSLSGQSFPVLMHGETKATTKMVPAFSTDIAAAWTLITPADDFGVERSIINGMWRWTASFSRGGVAAARIADTAPLAISEAFLAFTEALASRTKEQP